MTSLAAQERRRALRQCSGGDEIDKGEVAGEEASEGKGAGESGRIRGEERESGEA